MKIFMTIVAVAFGAFYLLLPLSLVIPRQDEHWFMNLSALVVIIYASIELYELIRRK